jgi:hypothetical protein
MGFFEYIVYDYIYWLVDNQFLPSIGVLCCAAAMGHVYIYVLRTDWLIEWNELADYGQEQEMEIEALEAILMDEFEGTLFLSFFFPLVNKLMICNGRNSF